MRFEAVVANPPFSAKWSASPQFMSDDRFSQYGKLAPKTHADFAFVQHMIHQLSENGIMAVVMPHGALYRPNSENHIRKYLINDRNYLDAVIGLPNNIFYGTPTPTCILVFKKCRKNDDNVLFIDASNGYEKIGNKNYLRNQDVNKISETFRNRVVETKYSYLAKLDEIEKNGFKLPLSKYINPIYENVVNYDLNKIESLFKKKNKLIKGLDSDILEFCEELNIPLPIGTNIKLLMQYKREVLRRIMEREIFFENKNVDDEWENKELGELLDYEQPTKYIVKSTDYNNTFKTPVLTAGKTFILGYTNEIEGIFENIPVIIFDDFTTANKFVDFNFKVKSSAMKILKPKTKDVNIKFIYEAMQLIEYPSVEHKRYWISEYQFLTVNMPKIEEQNKIASFLTCIDNKINLIKS